MVRPKVPGYRKRKNEDLKQILNEYLDQWRQDKTNMKWKEATSRTGLERKQINKYLHDQNKKFRDLVENPNEEKFQKKIIFEIFNTKT